MSMFHHQDPTIEAAGRGGGGAHRATIVSKISLPASNEYWLERVQNGLPGWAGEGVIAYHMYTHRDMVSQVFLRGCHG